MKKTFFGLLAITLLTLAISFTPPMGTENKQLPVQPKNLTITLPVEAWNVVIKGLSELPLKESGAITQEIFAQAQKQQTDSIKKK